MPRSLPGGRLARKFVRNLGEACRRPVYYEPVRQVGEPVGSGQAGPNGGTRVERRVRIC
ncbi:MAG: hypothetical protein OXT71_15905 [Acidobacteriota bacterium]|nr:hypothetical protein [Acidobacteriota bacterium]